MSETTSACFMWKDPSSFSLDAVCLTVGKRSLDKVEKIVCCSSVSASELGHRFPSIQAFLLNECRASGFLSNKHTTYFSQRDLILALRMHIDAINRKEIDNGSNLTASDLSICYQRYLNLFLPEEPREWNIYEKTISAYRNFLRNCNSVDDCSLGVLLSTLEGGKVIDNLQKNNLLVLGSPLGTQERALMKLLLGNRKLYSVTTETSLDSSFRQSSLITDKDSEMDSVQVILSELTWQMLEDQIRTDGLSETSLSSEQRYEEDVILSFLRLVVNVRDELALIKALMSPLVSLPQSAFLHLKRQAALKGLSICQTLMSYVIRVRLGGQSYAPSLECPLKEYLPQLTSFTQVLEKLQTIVEEETNSLTAVKKVLLCVTKSLMKVSRVSFRQDRLQAATEKLTLLASTLEKESSQCPASELSTTELLQRLLDWCSSQCYASPLGVCFGMSKSGATPQTALSPFTFFRTPEEIAAEDMPSLSQRISSSNKSQTPVCTKKFKAGLPWGIDPNHVETPKVNMDSVLTGRRPVDLPVSSPEQQQAGIKRVRVRQTRVKRSILWETTNKNPSVQSPNKDAPDKRSGPEDSKSSSGTNKENNIISEFPNASAKGEKILSQVATQCKRNENEISVNRKRKRKEKPILKGQTNIKAFFNQRI